MTEVPIKLWLNWEAFEVASIGPLFTTDISIEKIEAFAEKFTDLNQFISLKDWNEKASQIFRLSNDQLEALYICLNAFLMKDPHDSLLTSQLFFSQPKTPNLTTLRVSELLCYLFAIYVKKKYRNVAEASKFEQFPSQKESERLSPRTRQFSSSSPTVGARMTIKTKIPDKTPYVLMLRFFITKLPSFLNILCPNEVTHLELDSLSFLICGGFNYSFRAQSLNSIMNENDYTSNLVLFNFIYKNLNSQETPENNSLRSEIPFTSPLAYRPSLNSRIENSSISNDGFINDRPITISDITSSFKHEIPSTCPNVHIHSCKHSRIYILGVTSSVFISHCKDSLVFIGASVSVVHLEYCANVTIIASARFIHLDACTKCTSYLLVNSRPLVTGNCHKLVFAPYNAVYNKFLYDITVGGVNPLLNRWKEPLVFGSLGFSTFSIMTPSDFNLFQVPILFNSLSLLASPPLPEEYLNAIEEKKKTILNLKKNLDRIKNINLDLHDKIVDSIKSKSSKWIQDEGSLQEITWLYGLIQEQNFRGNTPPPQIQEEIIQDQNSDPIVPPIKNVISTSNDHQYGKAKDY